MKHYGDIKLLNGGTIAPVDIIVGGSPCQGFSIAGTRGGLEDDRSGLLHQMIRVIKEMRNATNNTRPRYVIWENVPGAFSTAGGEDFRAALEAFCRLADETAVIPRLAEGWRNAGIIVGDGWSIAWRIHDAQFWGVPQRRRRISLIVDFGSECAAEILFDEKGVSRDTPPGGSARERAAADAPGSAGNAIGFVNRGNSSGSDISETLRAECGRDWPCVAYSFDSLASNSMKSTNPKSGCRQVEIAKTLDTAQPDPSKNQGGSCIIETPAICLQGNGIDRAETASCNGRGWRDDDICYTLNTIDRPAVYAIGNGQADQLRLHKVAGSLNCMHDTQVICIQEGGREFAEGVATALRSHDEHNPQSVCHGNFVRRLTPLECERLQGYPDSWTDIGDYIDSRGKRCKTTDAKRYKALGNSIALPFWRWLLARLYSKGAQTLGSLFDGIGGFPLCWRMCGGVTTWTCEIDEYCTAVVRKRFDEVSI
jgi:Site-specific DNA methylase